MLTEELVIGTTKISNLRILEIDLCATTLNGRDFTINIINPNNVILRFYYAGPYFSTLDSSSPFHNNEYSTPTCGYSRCEIGFIYRDGTVKGNNIFTATTSLNRSKWAAHYSFVKSRVPDYVKKVGHLPPDATTPEYNIYYGPFWPLTTGQEIFTSGILEQKVAGDFY
uniref:Major capsid protein n=1 Tax=Parastrongyloides trichosuri TaxID=131310 RepID=A0A0N5A0C5_PARTI